jgi:hypothetical protein
VSVVTDPSRLRPNSARDREWATPGRSARRHLLSAWCSYKSLALGLLASELSGAADRISLFPIRFFGRLLVKSSALHLTKNAFALHFFLSTRRAWSTSLSRTMTCKKYFLHVKLSEQDRIKRRRQQLPFSDRVDTIRCALRPIRARLTKSLLPKRRARVSSRDRLVSRATSGSSASHYALVRSE